MAWTFPVVGTTEWSPGSWMPSTLTHRGRTHGAVDIYASRGQMIVSPVSGTVRALKSDNIGGNWIQITGNDGNVYYFAHMDAPTALEKGQKVTAGMAIGAVGNSGSAGSTKTHLHFSVKRNGKAVSPVDMLIGGIVIPDLEFGKTGVSGATAGHRTPTNPWSQGVDVGNNTSQPLPPEAQEGVPAWFEQLAQYREELRNQPQSDDPIKLRAAQVLRGSLSGMANMVRAQGYTTAMGDDTGIDDEGNMISRESTREPEERER